MPVGATIAAAGIGAAGSIGSSLISSKAAGKAADRQMDAAERARAELRADTAPFTNTGKSAVLSLAELYGLSPDGDGRSGTPFPQGSLDAFTRSPDYAFARDQGIAALERSAAARGQLRSGNLMRDLTQFGSGLATQNFGNYVGRLMQLAQLGSSSIPNTSNLILGSGEAQASGIIGQANALSAGIGGASSAFNQGAGNLLMYDMLRNPSGSTYAPVTAGSGPTYLGGVPSAGASPTLYSAGGLY